MAVYEFRGFDNAGKAVKGVREADTEKGLRAQLRRENVMVTEVKTGGRKGKGGKKGKKATKKGSKTKPSRPPALRIKKRGAGAAAKTARKRKQASGGKSSRKKK